MTNPSGQSLIVLEQELSDLAEFFRWVLTSEPRPQLQTVTGWVGSLGRAETGRINRAQGKYASQDLVPYRIELQFYGSGQSVTLAFQSGIGATFSNAGSGKWTKAKKPIELFLRSHFVGSRLVTAEIGHTLVFEFQNGNQLTLSARKELSDHLCLRAEAVALKKAIEARLAPIGPSGVGSRAIGFTPLDAQVDGASNEPLRGAGLEQQVSDHLNLRVARAPHSSGRIEKLNGAIRKVELEIAIKSSDRERKCAEWIIANQSLDVPSGYKDLLRPEWSSLGQASNELFSAAKRNEKKLSRTQGRLLELKSELAREVARAGQPTGRGDDQGLRNQFPEERHQVEPRREESLLRQANAKGRTVRLDERLTLYVGKSAKENLSLLRQAQPFDYWLHIKDEPGAHGILRRPRGVEPTPSQFQLAARWVLFYSLKQKRAQEVSGQSFDVLLAQCRYVRPIKGDRLGRVQHTHAEVIRVVFDPAALQN